MIERAFFALFSLGCLATTATALYQTAKWFTQQAVSVEVRNSRLAIDLRKNSALLPVLHVELAAQADGAPATWRQIDLPQDEIGLGLGLLAQFAPGKSVSLWQTRGNPTEIFLTPADAREPLDFAIAMGVLTCFCGFFLLALGATCWPEIRGRRADRRTNSAAWLLFFSVGILALTLGLAAGAYRSWQANFWAVVVAKRVEMLAASLPLDRLLVSEKAKDRFAEASIAWSEFESEGKPYRLPASACSVEPCVLLVNPRDPGDWTPPFDGNSDAWTPTWIGLLFGSAFTGAGWFIRKTGM